MERPAAPAARPTLAPAWPRTGLALMRRPGDLGGAALIALLLRAATPPGRVRIARDAPPAGRALTARGPGLPQDAPVPTEAAAAAGTAGAPHETPGRRGWTTEREGCRRIAR